MNVNFSGLEDSSILADFTPSELQILVPVFTQKDIEAGKTVFVENMAGESLYLIQRGVVCISKMLAEGDEETLVVLGPSDVFGEMTIFDSGLRSATARIAEDASLFCLTRKNFEKFCTQEPHVGLKLALNIIRLFSSRIRASQETHRGLLLDALGRRR
ncbi:MAG: cyclic nucleotide-binding domain-containing protein [Deltaproteobacteria bacterium]|nr:cyclic nucleotide-binding domain-containing protein [Deltaproteobacteria bacterium]